MLMPVKDRSTSRVRLVDAGCHSFFSKKSGVVLLATKDQIISSVENPAKKGSASMHYRRGKKRSWEYMQKIPVQFLQG